MFKYNYTNESDIFMFLFYNYLIFLIIHDNLKLTWSSYKFSDKFWRVMEKQELKLKIDRSDESTMN